MENSILINLNNFLESIEDPRSKKGQRYRLASLLICLIYGLFAGYDNCVDISDYDDCNYEYFAENFGLKNVPSHDTFSRVLRIIDVKNLACELGNYLSYTYPLKYKEYGGKKVLHIDGKALKASTRKSLGEDTIYLLNSMYEGGSISLYSEKIAEKSNEIAAIPKYLDNFDLKDCIVTIDAIGCNENVINKILEKKGSFLIPVKENQKTLLEAIKRKLKDLRSKKILKV